LLKVEWDGIYVAMWVKDRHPPDSGNTSLMYASL